MPGCLSHHAKLVAITLDRIEKFLAFGFRRGNGNIPDGICKRLVQSSSAVPLPVEGFAVLVGAVSSAAT